ncbi:uncharacterized oxidoreductase Tda5p [[Candida] railenensis]|uniref:Uncharacterized oxidoreductase Tda5p n=1 Tax=[Candida] railenensis TaxID=45579 RepID=A0A9P0QS13_9ASCO|nr:uncharacterized oxidoreductase Tda5p [[Candida] railenensis]
MGPLLCTLLVYHLNKQCRRVANVLLGHFYEPHRDIVCVTGGSSGLGKEIARVFSESGAVTVVLDITIPPVSDQLPNVKYYLCDVSNCNQIIEIGEVITREVGIVSILVNNAGISHGKSLLDLNYDEIEKTIRVNLLSSFYTIKVFLPNMLKQKRGYIVTVASVLGYMSPARLSDYGASKSGLIALHESLTYELGPPSLSPNGIKTLLICPGQLKTNMFSSIQSPSSLFAPELEPSFVAKKLINALELGRRGEIKIPFYGNFMPVMRAIPWPAVEFLRDISGMDESMKKFKSYTSKLSGISDQGSKNQSEANSITESTQ